MHFCLFFEKRGGLECCKRSTTKDSLPVLLLLRNKRSFFHGKKAQIVTKMTKTPIFFHSNATLVLMLPK